MLQVVGDVRILRYVRACENDINAAADAFKSFLQWRMVERVDAIRQELFENNWSYKDSPGYPRMVKHLCVNFNHKTDRFGNLVILERIGVSSLKTLCADLEESEFLRQYMYMMERASMELDRLSREQGKLVKITNVKDLSDMGSELLYKKGLNYTIAVAKMLQQYYPESMAAVFVINIPRIFNAAFKVIKPAINPRTLKKIQLLGSDFQAAMGEYFDPHELPVELGGTCTCAEEGGCFPITVRQRHGSLVKISVGAGKIKDLPLAVSAKDFVTWRLFAQSSDVKFSTCFIPAPGIEAAVAEVEVTSTADCAKNTEVAGEYTASGAGQFILRLNNSASRIRSKTVTFEINSLSGGEEELKEAG